MFRGGKEIVGRVEEEFARVQEVSVDTHRREQSSGHWDQREFRETSDGREQGVFEQRG